jgi:hypothetical protein
MKLARSVLTYLAGSALALGSIAADEPSKIHECTDVKGNVVYQDDPCIEAVPVPPKPQVAPKPRVVAKPRAAALPPAPRPAGPAPPGRLVDARWATPEKTLRTFVGAVKAGDRALVLSCLTSQALADLGPDAEALPLERLNETVSSFTGYVSEGDLGPFWSIRALREGTRPKWIFFEETGNGEWKIGAL